MASGTFAPDPESTDPYEQLGITPDAGFESVQQARQQCLDDLPADDAQSRARVEAAYDSILMQRLKERQLGQLTGAAASASKRETSSNSNPSPLPGLPSLPALPRPKLELRLPSLPSLSLASGPQLWAPVITGSAMLLALLLIGASPGTAELLLALAALLTVVVLQKRLGRFPAAVGWSFALLLSGLLIGAALVPFLSPLVPLAMGQLQAIPSLLLLLLGALLIS
jgi:hypothetical protein